MHTPSRFLVVTASSLALFGCMGEADWSLQPPTAADPTTPTAVDAPARLSSFQGLSSGLPEKAKPVGIAHLDGTVYLVVAGQLFSLGSGAQTWSPVTLPLNAG